MPGDYTVTIEMASATVLALSRSQAHLYGMLAVQTSDRATQPVVWLETDNYMASTVVQWSGATAAYTALAGSTVVHPGFSVAVSPGQVLEVDEPDGSGDVKSQDYAPTALAFYNATDAQFTAGVSQTYAGSAAPICSVPLYGGRVNLIVPQPMALLTFAAATWGPGSALTKLLAPGILVDLTSAPARAVTYDINQGWSWGGYAWGQKVGPFDPVVPLLIEPSSALEDEAEKWRRALSDDGLTKAER
jgi:hypothetical protein